MMLLGTIEMLELETGNQTTCGLSITKTDADGSNESREHISFKPVPGEFLWWID